jgi:hypothetical protein
MFLRWSDRVRDEGRGGLCGRRIGKPLNRRHPPTGWAHWGAAEQILLTLGLYKSTMRASPWSIFTSSCGSSRITEPGWMVTRLANVVRLARSYVVQFDLVLRNGI